MYNYKVLKFRLDLCDTEEIETELNNYANDHWRVISVVSNSNPRGTALYVSSESEIVFVLEKNYLVK